MNDDVVQMQRDVAGGLGHIDVDLHVARNGEVVLHDEGDQVDLGERGGVAGSRPRSYLIALWPHGGWKPDADVPLSLDHLEPGLLPLPAGRVRQPAGPGAQV